MRYRILASFQGAPYEAGVGPSESDVVLFAACPPPEELRFEPATGHWRKRVSREHVQTLYESRPVGMFRGERCIVLDDLSDRLHIVYLGHDALRAAQLGYWEVDRGVFELITPRHEVTDIVEQRLPLPIRSDSGQHCLPGPMPSGRPDDYGGAGNGVSYGRTDSQPFSYGDDDHNEFATGPRLFDRRASLDGRPSSYPQDPPIAGQTREELGVARPADQSDVAIPLVPEAPLPLEAEALRAASSAARRGQKASQSRQGQDARGTRRPQPAAEPEAILPSPVTPPAAAAPALPQVPPAPVTAPVAQVPDAPAQQVAARPVRGPAALVPEPGVPEPQAEVSRPLPAPVPAAAMLSKAAMLSHAAATAARQAAAASSKQSDPPTSPAAAPGELSARGEQENQPGAQAGLARASAVAQRQDEPEPLAAEPAATEPAATEPAATEPPATADRTSLGPEPTSQAPEPAQLAPAPVGVPAMPEVTAPVSQPAATATYVDQPPAGQAAADEQADTREHDQAGSENARSADYQPVPVPASPVLPVPGQDSPTSLEQAEPATTQAAEPVTAAQPGHAAIDHADEGAGASGAGISDPPAAAHPPAASTVPSWTPLGPAQPQPGFDGPRETRPTHDIAPRQAGYYAPYVTSEPGPPNGMPATNGTAALAGFGQTAPMPIPQPNVPPPPALQAQPGPPQQAVDEMPEPAAEAEADPATTTPRRRGTKRRLPTQKIFSDLTTQAAIPAAAYAIGEEVDGAMCLVRTDEGFEVFNAAAGARHEVRVFADEESAYFYLFGVLVAESVRTGALVPRA